MRNFGSDGTNAPAVKKMGRPREFDTEKALDAAMRVFWTCGYEAASLSALTQAMGINRPSLYAAFGSKERLFRTVLDRYLSDPAAYLRRALQQPTARAVIQALLEGAVHVTTDSRNPPGCLLTLAALVGTPDFAEIRKEVSDRRAIGEQRICRRLKRAQETGDLPESLNVADLTSFIATLIYGIAIKAASGASRGELGRMVRLALRVLPEQLSLGVGA